MKVILPRSAFQEALGAMTTLTGGRSTRPILACVKIDARDNAVELSSSDGEASLRLAVPALSLDRPGVAVVSADRLLAIVRELGDVEVSLEADDRHCTIRGEGSQLRIFVMNPEDFPPAANFDGDPDMEVDGHALRKMIGRTIYAAARETSRYAINGVLWEKSGKHLFLVATDGRRLARAGGSVHTSSSGDFEVVVPGKALSVFEKVFTPPRDQDEWTIGVKVMPNQILLRSSDRVLSTILVEGHFPKYEDVIPTDNDKLARLGREELLSAVRRAALLTTEDSRAVKLQFEKESLVITSQSAEEGDARVEIGIHYEGDPVQIGFNPVFLGDALRAVTMDEVYLELHESFRPGILRGEDKDEFLYVVMPVSLSGSSG